MVAGYVHEGSLTRIDPKADPGLDGRDKTVASRPKTVRGRLGAPSSRDVRYGDQLSLSFDVVFRTEPGPRRADSLTFAGQDPAFDGTYDVVGILANARDHRLLLRRLDV